MRAVSFGSDRIRAAMVLAGIPYPAPAAPSQGHAARSKGSLGVFLGASNPYPVQLSPALPLRALAKTWLRILVRKPG